MVCKICNRWLQKVDCPSTLNAPCDCEETLDLPGIEPSQPPIGMKNVRYCTECDNDEPTHDNSAICKCGGDIEFDCVDDECFY